MKKLISAETLGTRGYDSPEGLQNMFELIQTLETAERCEPDISYEELIAQNEKEANVAVNQLRLQTEKSHRFNISEQPNLNRFWTFETMDQDPGTTEYAYRAISFTDQFCKYAQDPYQFRAPNLIIIGRTGSGKSHLAGAITHRLINNGFEPLFITMNSLIDNFFNNSKTKDQSSNQENLSSGSEFLDKVKTARFLILEDIITASSPMKSFYADLLSSILRTRVNLNLSTVITCGNTFPEMHEILGDYTFGSIQELHATIITLPNINRRGTIANYDPERRSEVMIPTHNSAGSVF